MNTVNPVKRKDTLKIVGIRYSEGVTYSLSTGGDLSAYGYFTCGEFDVEWEAPTEDTTQAEIESLQAMKASFIRESTSRLEKIDDQIARLKCLECAA